jgi:hypothetical protein
MKYNLNTFVMIDKEKNLNKTKTGGSTHTSTPQIINNNTVETNKKRKLHLP